MLNKNQMIEKLNFHFPSYIAFDGGDFDEVCEGNILFGGEYAYANFVTDHDENGNYSDADLLEKTCPVYMFLERHDWNVQIFCDSIIMAVKKSESNEWDRLIEKSKFKELTELEKNRLKELQTQMVLSEI